MSSLQNNIMSTVCLCAIVRNESRIIQRMLDSLPPAVTFYVILDTQSTDDTADRIETSARIPGIVIRNVEFQDFGTCRTRAWTEAQRRSTCDYILLLDADMALVGQWPQHLTADVYYSNQIQGDLAYNNVRLIRRSLKGVECIGATHEYWHIPPGATTEHLDPTAVYIHDYGDGGSKADKFPRDERLLRAELARQTEPNPRTIFYLAQTLACMGRWDEALSHYTQRSGMMHGFAHETEQAYCGRVHCLLALARIKEAETCEEDHATKEGAYLLCKHHREQGNHARAFYFYARARSMRHAPTLFLQLSIDRYLLDYEASILFYYLGLLEEGCCVSWRLLRRKDIPGWLRESVWQNLRYYELSVGNETS